MRGLEREWWTLFVVCAAAFMLLLDITVVNPRRLPRPARCAAPASSPRG